VFRPCKKEDRLTRHSLAPQDDKASLLMARGLIIDRCVQK